MKNGLIIVLSLLVMNAAGVFADDGAVVGDSLLVEKQYEVGAFLGISRAGDLGAIALGIFADTQIWKAFGVEVSAFHDLAHGRTDTLFSSADESKNMQYGALVQAKAETSFQLYSARVTPKLGLGYGVREGSDVYFSGPTAAGGLELEIKRLILVDVGIVVALGGNVLNEGASISGVPQGAAFPGHDYTELTAGLGIRLTDIYILEAKYVSSSLSGFERTITMLQLSRWF